MAIAKDAISGKSWLEGDKVYCVIITLDVKMYSTLRIGMPRWLPELLKDRVLLYDTDYGKMAYAASAGYPQGSVLELKVITRFTLQLDPKKAT